MRFTKDIIIEAIKTYRGSHFLDERCDEGYRCVSLLPADSEDMENEVLYTCLLSEAIRRNAEISTRLQIDGESRRFTYLCIRDRMTDDEEEDGLLDGMLIVNENRGVAWLFNLMQSWFLRLSDWERDMQLAILDGCDFQQIIDLCEPILCNFVLVCDASYKLLAYTKNIANKDPINIALVEHGYHTEETLRKFKRLKRFGVYEREPGLIQSAAGEVSAQFDCVSKWCRYGSEPILHVAMVCSETPLSQVYVELFEVLMGYVERVLLREQSLHPAAMYSSLLHEIIYGDLEDPFIIAERAKISDVPFSGFFNAYRIVFRDNATVLVGRFVQLLATYLPRSKIIAQDYEVSVMNIYETSNVRKPSEDNLLCLQPLFEKYGVMCGVSEAFSTLSEFRHACVQATRAQALGAQMEAAGNQRIFSGDVFCEIAPVRGAGEYHYDDVYIYHMLHMAQGGTFDVFQNTYYNRALERLIAHDRASGTQLVQILYAYLVNERRATTAGRFLHMHRNNVLYHISRAEEILELSLEDYWVRLKLMLAYHFFELQASNRTFIFPDAAEV